MILEVTTKNNMDYVFPNWFVNLLKRPSVRTQLESTMVGILMFILAGLGTSIYLIIFTDFPIYWKFLSGLAELGLILFMFPNLVQTYSQYYIYKTQMDLYPRDIKLIIKIEEAKDLIKEINVLINNQKEVIENVK